VAQFDKNKGEQMTTVTMRCTRVSQYDSGEATMRELTFSSSDRDGKPLNPPEKVAFANLSVTFVSPEGDEIDHDSLVDVSLNTSAPKATSKETGKAES
jgi:hypothetical protein